MKRFDRPPAPKAADNNGGEIVDGPDTDLAALDARSDFEKAGDHADDEKNRPPKEQVFADIKTFVSEALKELEAGATKEDLQKVIDNYLKEHDLVSIGGKPTREKESENFTSTKSGRTFTFMIFYGLEQELVPGTGKTDYNFRYSVSIMEGE